MGRDQTGANVAGTTLPSFEAVSGAGVTEHMPAGIGLRCVRRRDIHIHTINPIDCTTGSSQMIIHRKQTIGVFVEVDDGHTVIVFVKAHDEGIGGFFSLTKRLANAACERRIEWIGDRFVIAAIYMSKGYRLTWWIWHISTIQTGIDVVDIRL